MLAIEARRTSSEFNVCIFVYINCCFAIENELIIYLQGPKRG